MNTDEINRRPRPDERQYLREQRAKTEALAYFEASPDFRIERFVGTGSYGLGILVTERTPGTQFPAGRRLVVKRPMGTWADNELKNKISKLSVRTVLVHS